MSDQLVPPNPKRLGDYLKFLRSGKRMSLREVEEATNKEVSNAYLSQLETGKISKPSPNILHSLALVYGASYKELMTRAGYITPTSNNEQGEKHGRAATFAIENLSEEEESELLKYLEFFRERNRH